MKLLVTLWISVVLAQEVFSSALVRYPRNVASKPTSSVHTEYEATYEQKGKHGNGTYSTVSGKQEVVHDNCHDNWNAFADKCATLIKDLVASLGNAVSSKPGDATNLQLRIRNTFKHFDSTDNCTCLINTKKSLSSLLDNMTASTAQPETSNGAEALHQIPSVEEANGQMQSGTCQGEPCNEGSVNDQQPLPANPKILQQSGSKPKLVLTNTEKVDPELADTSKESSITNSRRGVLYPEVKTKDLSQSSGSQSVPNTNSKQSAISRPSSVGKKILFPVPVTPRPAVASPKAPASPAEVVVPLSQPPSSSKTPPLYSAIPSQDFTNQRPTENNGIAKSGVKPETALSSASSTRPIVGSGSPQVADAMKPMVVTVKPVSGVVPIDSEGFSAGSGVGSGQIPSGVTVTKPVTGLVAEPQLASVSSEGSPIYQSEVSKSGPTDSAVAVPQIASGKSEGSPTVFNPESNKTPTVISVPEPVNSAVPKSVSGGVAEPQIITVKEEKDREEDCDEEKGSEQSSVSEVLIPESGSGGLAEPQMASQIYGGSPIINSAGSNENPNAVSVAKPVTGAVAEPQSTSSKREGYPTVIETPSAVSVPELVNGPVSEPMSGDIAEPKVITVKEEKDKEENCDEEKGSEQSSVSEVLIPESGSGGLAEPQISVASNKGSPILSNSGSGPTPNVVSVPEPVNSAVSESVNGGVAEPQIITVKEEKDKEEDRDGKMDPEQISVSKISEPESRSEVLAEPQMTSQIYGGSPIINSAGSNENPNVVSVAKPITGIVAEPQSTSSKREGYPAVIETPSAASVPEPVNSAASKSVGGDAAEPQIITVKEEKDKEEDREVSVPESGSVVSAEPQTASGKSEGSPAVFNPESNKTPTVVSVPKPVNSPVSEPMSGDVAEPKVITAKEEQDKEENCDEEKGSEQSSVIPSQVSIKEPINGAIAEPEIISSGKEGNKDEKFDKLDETPIVPTEISSAEPESGIKTQIISIKNEKGDKGEDCEEEKGSASDHTSVVPTVISKGEPVVDAAAEPQITSTDEIGDKDDGGAAGNGPRSGQRTVVKPLTSSFQDPSTVAYPNLESSVVPAMPASNSGESKMPVITQAEGSSKAPLSESEDSALPQTSTTDTVNVIPGLIVKQPRPEHSAHKNPSAEVPLINSGSNLPDSTAPVRTVNPSPVYEPLPSAPSPSSDSAVLSNDPQSVSAVKEIPVTVDQSSQSPTKTAVPLTEGKGKKESDEHVFIVTPIPVYLEKKEPVIVQQPKNPSIQTSNVADPLTGSEQTGVPVPEAVASRPQGTSNAMLEDDKSQNSRPQDAPTPVTTAPIYTAPVKPISGMSPPESQSLQPGRGSSVVQVDTPQMGNDQQEILLTTPIPLVPIVAKKQNDEGRSQPSLQQHPLLSNLGNKKTAITEPVRITGEPAGQSTAPNSQLESFTSAPGVAVPKVAQTHTPKESTPSIPVHVSEDADLAKATTFQTTSTDPTPPQQSIQSPPPLTKSVTLTGPASSPQDSFEAAHSVPATSPQAVHGDDDDDDCCSCESCTEEEVTNPKQYKEMACKDLEEARKELKTIFDKITKRLKCGKKAPQKIVAS